jgi:uncharacterized Zn-finger protein
MISRVNRSALKKSRPVALLPSPSLPPPHIPHEELSTSVPSATACQLFRHLKYVIDLKQVQESYMSNERTKIDKEVLLTHQRRTQRIPTLTCDSLDSRYPESKYYL